MTNKLRTNQQEVEEKYVIFERPHCCVKDFLAQDCEGIYHRLKEINPDQIHKLYEGEMLDILESLKGEEVKRYKKGDFLEHRDEYNSGFNSATKNHNSKIQNKIKEIKR